ncbi:Holliday junction resolvase RuvX [Candidatus Parcubacteria bacterium]|nr:MAG: Holliday junction resolvase RuvX [Candidatus Parcubacteria bacterium]
MKYLGIDYGAKRIGTAISDKDGRIAFPHRVIPNSRDAASRVARLVAEEHIAAIVIGDTRAVSGAANPVTKEAEEFAKRISAHTDIPVTRVWEAWSSIESTRYTEGAKNDASAAAIILQRFLDMRGGSVE